MKLRLLWCSEASILSTGYAVYAREMLKRLYATGKYEIAEFACYVNNSDERLRQVPWKVYGNLPDQGNREQSEQYNSNTANVFGAWRFDDVVLNFRPHVVYDYRDQWMMVHELSSAYRKYFHLSWMPTVDAFPQNKQWIDNFVDCDSIFTYNDWSANVLHKQTNGKIRVVASLPAGADDRLLPVQDKAAHKAKYGLDKFKIVGTVMRNQRRKLFPDLFEAFKLYLDNTGRTDVLLYCHTSYPDKHPWNIPELLNEFELASKVLFTYKCNNCGNTFPSFFNDHYTVCPRCHSPKASTANVQQGCSVEFLNEIYNLFDVYIQYANSEGFGLPQTEAAACGVPVMSVDYSAMSDVVRKIDGTPLKVKALYRELESGCYRAIPDNEYLAEKLIEFFNQPEALQKMAGSKALLAYKQNYGYDKSAAKYDAFLSTLNIEKMEQLWYSKPRIHNPPNEILPNHVPNSLFAEWLIAEVLGEPDKLGSYMHSRLVKDMNYGYSAGGMGGLYINENSMWFADSPPQEFSREKAFQHFTQLCHYRNSLEQKRWEVVNAR